MSVGILQTLWIKEIVSEDVAPSTLKEAVIEPFKEFFKRDGVKSGLLILSFIFFYKFRNCLNFRHPYVIFSKRMKKIQNSTKLVLIEV